jgi:predicted negative regulator of RcsB-dependent stress response
VDDLQSEKEQLEEMRAWWTEYGRYVIAGVVIAVGLLFGFNQYQSSKLAAQVEASVLYESLTVYVSDGDLDNAESVADDLASNYANTPYAAQSNLAMAKLYMDKNRDQDAADVLNELLLMRGNKALRQIGRLRLARILLYQDKPQDVVDLLADQDDAAFAGLFAEMRGDALAALGQTTAAGDEYRTALADTSQTINRGIVQMKLVDLPDAPAPAPAVTEPEQQAESAVDGEGGESE